MSICRVPLTMAMLVVSGLLSAVNAACAQTPLAVKNWGVMADEVKQRPDLDAAVQRLVSEARETAGVPVIKRVYRYADLGQHRTSCDGRAKAMDGQPRQEWFALSMSDFSASYILQRELPLLAFAYRCTGEERIRARVIAQLEEIAAWSPLQRPGWQLYTPSPDPVPADYWDGSWLATGESIRAIGDALELMPTGSLPAELVARLQALLRGEIKTIADDWTLKRGWFRVGDGFPQSNQWVLPTEGLVRACLMLGKDQFADEYEMGVRNLLRAMDVQGKDGEFNEGVNYATLTVSSMLAAARAMAVQGDRRGLDHPFLRGYPTWQVMHLQPGRFRINCFDAGAAKTDRKDGWTREALATLTVFAGSSAAHWALSTLYDEPPADLTGVLAGAVSTPGQPPPPFAFYNGPARLVTWRSNWEDNAAGVWVRGGHPLDSHDHFDRGHVNFIARGKPVLIEAGTPGYDNPNQHSLYSAVVGHNVLEIEGLKAQKAPAPITVNTLNATGGDVFVEPTACYPGLQQWGRHVKWDEARLTIADAVGMPEGESAAMTLRWHLGTAADAAITGADGKWQIAWPEGRITLDSSVPVQVTQAQVPDNTVCLGEKRGGWDFLHTCIVVRTAQPVSAWRLTTTVVGTP